MYRSTLPLTSALDGVGGRRHEPTALPHTIEIRYLLCRRLNWPHNRSGLCVKFRLHQDSIPGLSSP